MTTYQRPGVYINEILQAPAPAPAEASVSAACIVGALNRGPTAATLVRSWAEYRDRYGDFAVGGDMAYAAYLYFSNGGGDLFVQRVAGTGAAAATRTLNDSAGTPVATLKVDAINPGAWGNDISVEVANVVGGRFDLNVYYGGNTQAHLKERWTDLSVTATDSRFVDSVVNHVNAGSVYIKTTKEANGGTPAALTATVLTGGANGTAPTTSAIQDVFLTNGTSPLDEIDRPFDVNVPNVSAAGVINQAIAYAENRGDVFVVADVAAGLTVADAVTAAGSLTASSYAATYYPHIYVSDPVTTRPKLVAPGAAVLGRLAATDRQEGPWKAAAGLQATLTGSVQLERKLTDANLATLNENHINAIRNIAGNGLRIMGARTLKKRQADRYISVRRTLIYLKASLKRGTEFALFEPNDENLWEQITSVVGGFLSGVLKEGGLRGGSASEAFYVKCDGELNTQSVIDQGQVLVEVGVSLLQPAEFIVITVGQWQGGGATASEGGN